MQKIIDFFKIIFIIIIIDFFFTFFFISKLNFYNIFYPKLDHRVADKNFHHSFKKNVDTYDYWGNLRYKFITNSLGFKDNKNQNVLNKNNFKKRIIINGDSFTEGIGFEYDKTFVGILDEKLNSKNIEILNAGVASQSPILYFKKIQYLVESENLEFDELIIFLDISDIPDEYYYNQNFANDEIKKEFRDVVQEFLLKNVSTYLFLDLVFAKLASFKELSIIRIKAAKEFNKSFLDTSIKEINLYKSINVERGNWTHDELYWNLHGNKGRELANHNLVKLYNLCIKNNIKFSLVIYPWPNQIYYDQESKRHRKYWKNWDEDRNIKFIDLFNYFNQGEPIQIIEKYFIPGDIHWNKKGHIFVSNILEKEYFN